MPRFWHGSERRIERFENRPVHLGTRSQAEMRNGAWLHLVEVRDDLRLLRVRDDGNLGSKTVDRARRRGYDGVVYLNRYEGLSSECIETLARNGRLVGLDVMNDASFRRLVPEAEDSIALWDPGLCAIVDVVQRDPDRMTETSPDHDP